MLAKEPLKSDLWGNCGHRISEDPQNKYIIRPSPWLEFIQNEISFFIELPTYYFCLLISEEGTGAPGLTYFTLVEWFRPCKHFVGRV